MIPITLPSPASLQSPVSPSFFEQCLVLYDTGVYSRRKFILPVAVMAVALIAACSCGPAVAPPAKITVDSSPDRVARGKYLYTVVADCDSCHGERDYSRLYAPVTASGKGSALILQGLPGKIVAPNLTADRETGLGDWTDGEKIRAIREGISKDGHVLHPTMPYPSYFYMSDVDVQALVAYMNTLPAIRNLLPRTELPPDIVKKIRGTPRPEREPVPPANPANQRSYGEYLVTIAYCEECHTPQTKGGTPDISRRYAGGQVFRTPYGSVVSANITPDKDTGIGNWDFARFRDRLRTFPKEYSGVDKLPKIGSDRFTLMHYIAYAGFTDDDMAAIFAFLQVQAPVKQNVEPHPATLPAN
jgi:mono/diheme cytochrome c family protein